MLNRLFVADSKSTLDQRESTIRFFFFIGLFLFLLKPALFFSTEIKTTMQDQNHKEVIYVIGGASVISTANIHSLEIKKVASKKTVSKDELDEIKTSSISNQAEKIEKAQNERRNKILPNIRITKRYSNIPTEENIMGALGMKFVTALISSSQYSFRGMILAVTISQPIIFFKNQLVEQKYYTSLSYLQFGKYRSSSLRGPPQIYYKSQLEHVMI